MLVCCFATSFCNEERKILVDWHDGEETNVEITEVKVKLIDSQMDRLRAFCSITIDNCFVIHDLKIIEGVKGAFVAMPSRKITDICNRCCGKNHLRAQYCNECGTILNPNRGQDGKRRDKLHADIAHPLSSECRELIQQSVLDAYQEVKKKLAAGVSAPPVSDTEVSSETYPIASDDPLNPNQGNEAAS